MRTWSRGWWLRVAVPMVAFGLGLTAFELGVGTDARANVQGAGLLTHLYYTLGLFVLGGLDIGLPEGGPTWARAMLWVAYFMAPLVSAFALVEGLLRVLRPAWLERRGLRGHIVIVGAGRLGLLFLELLRESYPAARVVVIDKDARHANAEVIQRRFKARFVRGDVRNAATRDALAVERARAVVLLTDDDLTNLEVAWEVGKRDSPRVIAHVTDIALRRTVARVEPGEHVHLFNSHKIAAERLYEEHLESHFRSTAPEDVVVLAGFGRFGQTILEYLQREAHGEVEHAIVVDLQASRQARLFKAQVAGFESCELTAIDGDLDEPSTWRAVEAAVEGLDVPPVYVIATDDDQANLRAAVALRAVDDAAIILVRTVYESGFSHRLATEMRFTVLPVDRLLRDALREHQPRWLST